MDLLMQWLLVPGFVITCALSVLFSIRSRRSTNARTRGMFAARTNVSMGVMLLFIAAIQLFLSSESTLRIVIGALFMVLGIFNLFAGIRNLSVYRAMKG